jgi:hypothetical protein
MSSKYAKLRDKLPAFEQESSYQDRVNAWTLENVGENPYDANVSELAKRMAGLKRSKEIAEEQIYGINVALEALSQLIVKIMQSEDIEKVALSDGSSCYLSYEVYPQVKDKIALLGWVKSKKMSEMLSLPWQTLRGLCNESSLNGSPLPSGVESYLKVSARIRKNGEKE